MSKHYDYNFVYSKTGLDLHEQRRKKGEFNISCLLKEDDEDDEFVRNVLEENGYPASREFVAWWRIPKEQLWYTAYGGSIARHWWWLSFVPPFFILWWIWCYIHYKLRKSCFSTTYYVLTKDKLIFCSKKTNTRGTYWEFCLSKDFSISARAPSHDSCFKAVDNFPAVIFQGYMLPTGYMVVNYPQKVSAIIKRQKRWCMFYEATTSAGASLMNNPAMNANYGTTTSSDLLV